MSAPPESAAVADDRGSAAVPSGGADHAAANEARAAERSPSSPLFVYLLSPSYSGSTLLTYLLAQHPDIATIGELKATGMGDVSEYVCSCGVPILDCEFWARVKDEAARRGIEFSVAEFGTSLRSADRLTDVLLRTRVRGALFERLRAALIDGVPACRVAVSTLIRRNYELSRIVSELQGKNLFLDGSKDASRLLHFQRSGLWSIRTIFLTRDGRGGVNSFMSRKGIGIAEAVRRWKATVENDLHALKRLETDKVLWMRYEDLCADPAAALSRVWAWLDIDAIGYDEEFRRDDLHILGNAMRLSGNTKISLDERWRRELAADAVAYFDANAGALNRSLGYE